MKNILALICAALMCSSIFGFAILHDPPRTYAQDSDMILDIEIAEGLDSVSKIYLCFKSTETDTYERSEMIAFAPGSNQFTGTISTDSFGESNLLYYFEIESPNGQIVSYPDLETGGQPYMVEPEIAVVPSNDDFILISGGEDFPQDEVYILVISYPELENILESNKIKVWVDGKDVTSKSIITENMIVYRDNHPSQGVHKAQIKAVTITQQEIHSPVFKTTITRKKTQNKFEYRGNAVFSSNVYSPDHTGGYQLPGSEDPQDDYTACLEAFARYGKLRLNANLLLSSREKKNEQSVNRYHIGLDLSSLSLVAGDYSPQISPLVMQNRNLRGFYGSLYGEYISLQLAVGDIVKKTTLDEIEVTKPTFRQEAIGGRLRLGSENGMSLGLNFSRNRDIISSLPEIEYIDTTTDPRDTLFIVSPIDNAVISVDTKLNILWLRTVIGGELAASALNHNTWYGPITNTDISQYVNGLDFIHPSDLAPLFVINRNMEPLLPGVNNCAAQAWIHADILNNVIDARYHITGPVFNALSTWSQAHDTKNISVTDMFHLGRAFLVTGGYSLINDNYSLTASETNTYRNWWIQPSLRLFKVLTLRGGYYDSQAGNADNPDLQDGLSFSAYQRNSTAYNVGLGYTSSKNKIFPYQADLTYRTGINRNDVIGHPEQDYDNGYYSLNYMSYHKLNAMPLKLVISASYANQVQDRAAIADDPSEQKSITYGGKISYSFFNGKITPSVMYKGISQSGERQNSFDQIVTVSLESSPLKNMTINTGVDFDSYTNDNNDLNHSSLVWRFTFGQRF
jgi:hypothetical protein